MEKKKMLPIGMEFFADIRTRGYYYVDKTGFISELLNACGSVNLFTRPRRFGKSLNLDMLKCFFEIGTDAALFDGLNISRDTKLCEQHLGKYPVLSISLKDVQGADYKNAYDLLGITISEEAERLDYLLESERLTQMDKEKLVRLIRGDFEQPAFLQNSLKLLSRLLQKHYGAKKILQQEAGIYVVFLCSAVCTFCGAYFHTGQDRNRRRGFSSCHGDTDGGGRAAVVGHGIFNQKKLDLPDSLRAGHRRILALLLPGPAAGRRVQSRAGG